VDLAGGYIDSAEGTSRVIWSQKGVMTAELPVCINDSFFPEVIFSMLFYVVLWMEGGITDGMFGLISPRLLTLVQCWGGSTFNKSGMDFWSLFISYSVFLS
jgi:hypothetical protein